MKTKLLTAFLVIILAPTIVLAARPSFTSLQQQINQLTAEVNQLKAAPSPLYLVDGLGNRIGAAVDWPSASAGLISRANFMTATGYLSMVVVNFEDPGPFDQQAGELVVGTLFYEFPDCSGTPYANMSPGWAIGQGIVFAAWDASGSKVLFSAKEVEATRMTTQSTLDRNGCRSLLRQGDVAYPVTPNDPDVTGLSVTSFPTPITLQE